MGDGSGTGPNQFQFPEGLFIEPRTQILYVTDVSNNRVQKRYPNGQIKTAAGQANCESGSTPDKLNGPRDVVADENENVYVVDEGNQRVQFWEKDAKSGKMVAGDGTAGTSTREFSYPFRLTLDSKKNIFVSDTQNERVMNWSAVYIPKTSAGQVVAVSSTFISREYHYEHPLSMFRVVTVQVSIQRN